MYEVPNALGTQHDSRKANAWRTKVGTAQRDAITKKQFISTEHERDLTGKHSPAPNLYNPTKSLTMVRKHWVWVMKEDGGMLPGSAGGLLLHGRCSPWLVQVQVLVWRALPAAAAALCPCLTIVALLLVHAHADVARANTLKLPLWLRRPFLTGQAT